MRFSDIFQAIFIFFIFGTVFSYAMIATGIEYIKNNWSEYRCNPMVMPFSAKFDVDPTDNFIYCIQSMQQEKANELMGPAYQMMDMANASISTLSAATMSLQSSQAQTRGKGAGMSGQLLGKLNNVVISTQQMFLGVKDMGGKIFASILSVLYMTLGLGYTSTALITGPLGSLVG